MSGCLQGIKRSLDNLGVDSVDLVQFYWHNYQVLPHHTPACALAVMPATVAPHQHSTSREIWRLPSAASPCSPAPPPTPQLGCRSSRLRLVCVE